MKYLIFSLLLAPSIALAADKPALTDADASQLIASGACVSLGFGTGLVNGRGWLHEPYPGPVTIRVTDGGTIEQIGGLPSSSLTIDEWLAGKPYYVIVKPAGSHLVWKIPGFVEGPIPIGFQLPPSK